MQRPIILASSSPRRQYIMKEAGFNFTIEKPDVNEDFPDSMPVEEVAEFLARKKAEYFRDRITTEIVITADTTVVLQSHILNKPSDRNEAIAMLRMLSGKVHVVITGVCLLSREKELSFQDRTLVTFKKLTDSEIAFYVDNYKPYDKAGAYGAQDWIGMIAVTKVEGSYFNVMGLPVHRVYELLESWED
jgi:septum formation protein